MKLGSAKKKVGKVYFWAGILTCIFGIGLLIVPLVFFALYAYSFLTGTLPARSWTEIFLPVLIWIAIPGVPLLLGDILLRIANRLAPAVKPDPSIHKFDTADE